MTFVTNNNQETVLSGTWDNSGAAYTKLAINVNDVTSVSTSKLLDLQTQGISRFNVRKDGLVFTKDGRLTSDTTFIFHPNGQGQGYASISMYSLDLGQDVDLLWRNHPYATGGSSDTGIVRDGNAGALAQRVSTQSQTYRIYNTYGGTPAGTDFERASLGWNASAFEIETEAGGLGSARSLILGTSSIPRITITSTGNQTYNASNTAAAFDVHTKNNYAIHNYANGYVENSPGNTLNSSIKVVGYQGTNSDIKTILEVKDYRNTHWNNLNLGRSAGIGFVFENGNASLTPIAEKYVGGIYAVGESSRYATLGLAFAANGLTEMMRLSNAGNLGIGLTAPTQRLHVSGNAIITSSLVINSNPAMIGTVNDVLDIYRNGSGGDGAAISFKRDGGQTVAKIICRGSATVGSIHLDPYISYAPAQPNQHPFTFRAIAATGTSFAADFGIGNGTTHATLNIYNSIAATETQGINLANSQTSNGSNIALSWLNWQGQLRSKIVGEAIGGSTSGGALNFYTTNNSTGSESRMYLDSSGNVGIGTTTPQYRLHVAASSYPVLYASGTTANASSQFVFQANGKLLVGDGTFGEKIRFNNNYSIETFGGGGIRIKGGAYVTISDALTYEGAHFSPGYFGAPSLSIRSKFETQTLLRLEQQSWSTQTADYLQIAKLQSGYTTSILTVASSGWMGLGVSAPLAPLHVFASSFPLVKVQHSGNTVNSGWDFMVGNPGNYDGWFMIARSGQPVPGDFALDTGGNARVANSIYIKGTPLTSDANNILAQRLGTTSQKFRVYNTYGGADFEALEIGHTLYSGRQYQYVSAITSGTGAANIGMAIVPASGGSFSLAVPDGTVTGGNNRGNYSVDLQLLRNQNIQVTTASGSFAAGANNRVNASGHYGVALGFGNTVNGNCAFTAGQYCTSIAETSIAMGQYSRAQGNYAISMGYLNYADSAQSVAIGSNNNVNGGAGFAFGLTNYCNTWGAFGIGNGCSSVATYGIAMGNGTIARLRGQLAYNGANTFVAGTGDCQSSKFILRRETVDASPSALTLDGIPLFWNNTLYLPPNTAWFAEIKIVARQVSGVNHAAYQRRCLIQRTGNTVSIVSGVDVVGTDYETDPSWDVSVTANDSTDSLEITVTGAAATNIRWVAEVNVLEVGYGNS